jgi:TM2 domain-containing membrane protein YozV
MQPNAKTKKFPGQRHFLAVFFLSFMWGVFGVDRMYLGKWGTNERIVNGKKVNFLVHDSCRRKVIQLK